MSKEALSIDSILYDELMEILENQRDLMDKQVKFINKLINENIEQENMINVLMNEFKA